MESENEKFHRYRIRKSRFIGLWIVKLLCDKKVYNGIITKTLLIKFTDLTKRAMSQYLSETRLKTLNEAGKKEQEKQIEEILEAETPESKIITTDDELLAYSIVKAVASRHVEVDRVFMKDGAAYASIILDESVRKGICKLAEFN